MNLNSGDRPELSVRYVDPDNHYAVRIGKATGGWSGAVERIHAPLVRVPYAHALRADSSP